MRYSYKTSRFIRTFLLGGIMSFTLSGCFSVSDPVALDEDVVTEEPAVNTAPTITSTAILIATEATAYSYTLTATDADAADTLTMSATGLPAWLTFDTGTGVLSGTPASGDVGDVAITLTVNDGTDSVNDAFTITVSAAAAPVATPILTIFGDSENPDWQSYHSG